MKDFIAYHKISDFGEYRTDTDEFGHYSGKSEKQLSECINQRMWVISGRKLKIGTKYELVSYYTPTYIDPLKDGGYIIGGKGKGFSPPIDLTGKLWLALLIKEQNNFSYGLNKIKDLKIIDGLNSLVNSEFSNGNSDFPEEINENSDNYFEGAKKKIIVNAYERNKEARDACINHFSAKCQVCEINFEHIYGEIGKGFIHVHHIVPISTINGTYIVNPVTDLVPVCPNCHAMIHRKNPPFTVNELKKVINKLT